MTRARLGDVAEFINGVAFKESEWTTSGKRIIRIQNLNDSRKPYNRTTRDVPERYHVQPGDILVSWAASLGVFQWSESDVALLNQHIFRVLPNLDLIQKRYLLHALNHVIHDMEQHLHGATMRHINRVEVLGTELYLPSVDEQERIAALLDQVELLRVKRREAIALLDELADSIFFDMFGDPVNNPRGWDRVSLDNVLDRIESGTSPVCLERSADAEEWGVLKLGAVTQCVFNPSENKALRGGEPNLANEVKAGDLLFARKNTPELVAAVAYVREPPRRLLLPDLVFRLVPRNDVQIDKAYLCGLLTFPSQRRQVQSLASGSASSMSNISKAKLMRLECVYPPIELQRRYSQRVEALEALKQSYQAHLTELDALFASLQDRAFRGELWTEDPAPVP